MKSAFDISCLFGNDYNSAMMLEYKFLLDPLREYVACVENCISKLPDAESESFDNVCKMFANTMLEYAKATIDNILIGHVKAANILNRTIIENYVCLKAIIEHEEKMVWKYWLVHSFYNTPRKYGNETLPDRLRNNFLRMCSRLDIEAEFLEKKIIEKNYGWLWKVTNNFTFKGVCNLINSDAYDDYKLTSEFSHGTSFFQKIYSFTMDSSVINMISIVYLYLYLLMTSCFPKLIDNQFWKCDAKLEKLFKAYVRED